MNDEEAKQKPEQTNVEKQDQVIEETEAFEAELPPTPQDIDMPPVKPPKEESGE